MDPTVVAPAAGRCIHGHPSAAWRLPVTVPRSSVAAARSRAGRPRPSPAP